MWRWSPTASARPLSLSLPLGNMTNQTTWQHCRGNLLLLLSQFIRNEETRRHIVVAAVFIFVCMDVCAYNCVGVLAWAWIKLKILIILPDVVAENEFGLLSLCAVVCVCVLYWSAATCFLHHSASSSSFCSSLDTAIILCTHTKTNRRAW